MGGRNEGPAPQTVRRFLSPSVSGFCPRSLPREKKSGHQQEQRGGIGARPSRGPVVEARGLDRSREGVNMLRTALAEAVGTFLLVFSGTAVATAASLKLATAGPAYDSLAVALAFGLALSVVVTALGHISGAHVNPAVTLGLATTGDFPWRYVPAYLIAQLLGAILAALAT